MRALQALLLLFSALAVLTIGVGPAMAEPPACHDSTSQHGSGSPDSGDKALKAMNCCVACVAAPSLQPPERAAPPSPRPALVRLPGDLPRGEHPGPEPDPPRPGLH
jgi:hypothetical protein